MSSALLSETADEEQSLALSRNERTWPALEGFQPAHQARPVRELSPDRQEPDLKDFVAQDISSQLPFRDVERGDEADGTQLVAAYVASLEFLKQCRSDAAFLLEAICLSHMEFEQVTGPTDAAQRIRSEKTLLEDMLSRASMQLPVARNVATADLLAGPTEALRETFTKSLSHSVAEFVSALFNVFDNLVDEQIAGLFEWSGPSTCWYHFFKEVISQENRGTTTERDIEDVKGVNIHGDTVTVRRRGQIARTTHLRDTVSIVRHDHHVMNAFQTSLENSKVVVPLAVQGVINAIPTWLAKHIGVVDGTLFRESIRRSVRRTDDHARVEVETVDEPVFGPEPAVLIGHIVLAGWGPTEIEQELERREEVRNQEALENTADVQERSAMSRFVSPLLHCIAVALMVVACTMSPPWMAVRVLCSVGGLWTGFVARGEQQRVGQHTQTPMRNVGQAAATFSLTTALQALVLAAFLWSGWVLLAGIGFAVIAAVLNAVFVEE